MKTNDTEALGTQSPIDIEKLLVPLCNFIMMVRYTL